MRWIAMFALATLGFSASTYAAAPVKVYVTAAQPEARKKIDDATSKQLRASIDAARRARQDLEKQLKAQYGKKEEAWPDEQQVALLDRREAEALAIADWEYRRIDPEAIADSGDDVKAALSKMNENHRRVELVDSAEAADLVVELVARRSAYDPSLPSLLGRSNTFFLSFLLRAGSKMDPSQLVAFKQYRFRKFGYQGWALQRPRADLPVWRFETMGTQAWRSAAVAAAFLINDFVTKNFPQSLNVPPPPVPH
jgi:hypothetical protein